MGPKIAYKNMKKSPVFKIFIHVAVSSKYQLSKSIALGEVFDKGGFCDFTNLTRGATILQNNRKGCGYTDELEFENIFACSFTGNRPEKLPWGTNERDERCGELKERIDDAVRRVYRAGARRFICGMAKGCDMYFAEAVIALRDEYHGITLEAAIPCLTQSGGWNDRDRERYEYILHQCDDVTLISRDYTPGCMQRRNKYMVDSSQVLIAARTGTPGGTEQTIRYARRVGVRVIELMIDE